MRTQCLPNNLGVHDSTAKFVLSGFDAPANVCKGHQWRRRRPLAIAFNDIKHCRDRSPGESYVRNRADQAMRGEMVQRKGVQLRHAESNVVAVHGQDKPLQFAALASLIQGSDGCRQAGDANPRSFKGIQLQSSSRPSFGFSSTHTLGHSNAKGGENREHGEECRDPIRSRIGRKPIAASSIKSRPSSPRDTGGDAERSPVDGCRNQVSNLPHWSQADMLKAA